MKKFKILIGFIFFMSFSLRVNAVTISTDSAKSGTTDTNSKYITNTSTITINGVENSDAFEAYKILDYYYNQTTNVITYEFNSVFKNFLSQCNSDYCYSDSNKTKKITVDDYSNLSDLNNLIGEFASYIKINKIKGTSLSVSNQRATGILQVGSYLVLPTASTKIYSVMVGNLNFSANGTSWQINEAVIEAKSTSVSINKTMVDNTKTESSFNIGSEYTYYLTGIVPAYPDGAPNRTFMITDTMAAGITFSGISSVVVNIGGNDYTPDSNGIIDFGADFGRMNVTFSNNVLNIEFVMGPINCCKNSPVTIFYKAKLNNKAIISGTGNLNSVTMTYYNDPYGGEQTITTPVVTKAYTYGIKLFKHNSANKGLEGALYDVYSDNNLSNKVGTITTDATGYGYIKGIKEGTYYLKEVTAPTGYKISSDIVPVNVTHSDSEYISIDAMDTAMGLLPSTGGFGTYIFIIVGMLVIVGSIVWLYIYLKKKHVFKDKK